MGDVIAMQDMKNRRISNTDWSFTGCDPNGKTYPLKVWENLECILNTKNIQIRMNVIDHEIDYMGLSESSTRNGKSTDIYSLQTKEGLNLSRNETIESIERIAEKNKYNPFIEMLEREENNNYGILKQVFNCMKINSDYTQNKDHYSTIFVKWCLNVVKMAHNSLDNDFSSQGVLVLQGGQGCFKSTFARKLMPDIKWFKGDKSLDPEKTDSIVQNTSYILVEWGELDSTLKGEQAKLKQFITATNDEYRTPYSRFAEKYPRITSYIGTVNKSDFLKDETGSRRFWIIPVSKCDIDELDTIDMGEFWGAVYSLWKSESIEDYLTMQEQKVLNDINRTFAYENDITIIVNEKLDWDSDESTWDIHNITEICEYLDIREKKSLRIELEKRGLIYKAQRTKLGKLKKGFKIPRL